MRLGLKRKRKLERNIFTRLRFVGRIEILELLACNEHQS